MTFQEFMRTVEYHDDLGAACDYDSDTTDLGVTFLGCLHMVAVTHEMQQHFHKWNATTLHGRPATRNDYLLVIERDEYIGDLKSCGAILYSWAISAGYTIEEYLAAQLRKGNWMWDSYVNNW